MKSIDNNLITTDTISKASLDVWMLILQSLEYHDFIDIGSCKADSLLHETSKNKFRTICQSIDAQCNIQLPSNSWVKLIGPLEDLDDVIDEFDHFICLKPYTSSRLHNKSGVFLPNNFTLNNRIDACFKFQLQNPNFDTVTDGKQQHVDDLSATSVNCQIMACGSSLMGLQKGLLTAFICGVRQINCTGFNFSIDEIKYQKSYPSSFHTAQNRAELIAKSNYKHDLLFNFLFSKIAVAALFEHCHGEVKNIVNLDIDSFLSQFIDNNPI